MNKAYNIEYEEAPSGNVTFYNYKEPLMKFQDGFGYVGAVVFDTTSGDIQCHFCGQWFKELGNHIRKEHALNTEQYKKEVGLLKGTALINEKIRAQLIEHGRTHKGNLKNLRPGKPHTEETKRQIAATLKENRDEMKNIRGTCPEQLIERLVKLYDKLGRTPTTREIPFIEPLRKTYGSLSEACRVAGIPERAVGQTVKSQSKKIDRAGLVKALHEHYEVKGTFKRKELSLTKEQKWAWGKLTKDNLKERNNLYKEACMWDGRYRKGTPFFHYTDEELLEFLQRFKEINGRFPSTSDGKRGLIPNASKYIYHFGGWGKALKLAFPNEVFPETPERMRPKLDRRLKISYSLRQRFKRNKARNTARLARLAAKNTENSRAQ